MLRSTKKNLCKSFEVGNALLEGGILLCRGDGLLDVVDDPVDHVLLLHPPHNVGHLQLVVKTLLNLCKTRTNINAG